MAKIKLGARPKSFKHKVEVALPEGGKGTVEMEFKYRTRSEFGEFLDRMFADAKVNLPSQADEDVTVSLAEALTKMRDTNAQYIMDIAEGWDLESPFTRENVAQLCDELPGVAMAIINTYRAAITEGRLGN